MHELSHGAPLSGNNRKDPMLLFSNPLKAMVAASVFAAPFAFASVTHAAGGGTVQEGWSPTKPYPSHEVYYPGTEELGEEEIRVIACGSGMPMPRAKQAAACFLIELGNGEKFTGPRKHTQY